MAVRLKKIFCGLSAILMLLNFSGYYVKYDYDKDKMRLDEANSFGISVVQTIEAKDEETFRSYFTDEVSVSSDFADGMQYVFDLFSGEIESIGDFGTHMGGSYSARGESIIPIVICRIVTSENEYKLYFEYYQKDSMYQGKIIRLKLIENKGLPETGVFNNNGGMGNKTGVYHPGWDVPIE